MMYSPSLSSSSSSSSSMPPKLFVNVVFLLLLLLLLATVVANTVVSSDTTASTTALTTSTTASSSTSTASTASTTASTTTSPKELLLTFPGIYTFHYNVKSRTSSDVIKIWGKEYDLIKIECRLEEEEEEEEEEVDTIIIYKDDNCMAHLVIHSMMEYNEAIPSLYELSHSSLTQLLLEYNSSLTEQWIAPRLNVTTAVEERSIMNKNKRRRRLQQQQRQQRQQQGYYSTIETYDCYYDYDGTINWIENFVSNHSPLLVVEWIDIGDSYLKTKYKYNIESESATLTSTSTSTVPGSSVGDKLSQLQDTEEEEDKGHDIMVLTITGANNNNNNNKKKSSSSSVDSNSTSTTSNSSSNNNNNKNKKAPLILVSSTHAREYTPPELIRRWLQHLIDSIDSIDTIENNNNNNNNDSDSADDYLAMLETTKIHWIPYLNPDGRILAETTQPLRRKNLNINWTGSSKDSEYCTSDSYGVDLNRNFPFEWGKNDGSSNKPCSSSTRGINPKSESETIALINYLLSDNNSNSNNNNKSEYNNNNNNVFPNLNKQLNENAINTSYNDFSIEHVPNQSVEISSTKWKGYNTKTTQGVFIDIHSYGEVYIFPWGNLKNAITPNDQSYRSVMGHLQKTTGLEAKQAGINHYGVSSGCTDDWSYAVTGALSMTWELGNSFHEPCNDFENEYKKHFNAFDYLSKIAYQPYKLGKGPIINSVSILEGNTIALYYYYLNLNSVSNNNEPAIIKSMRTNTLNNLDTIKIYIKIEFPNVLKETLPSIVFDDGTTASSSTTTTTTGNDDDDEQQTRSISNIRVYYKNNPLLLSDDVDDNDEETETETETDSVAGISNITETTSSTTYTTSSNGNDNDHWDLLFYEINDESSSSSFSSSSSTTTTTTTTTYFSYINKNQLWSAFGVQQNVGDGTSTNVFSSPMATTTTTNHILYVQAIDNVGNSGPITATSLNIMLVEQHSDDDDDDDDFDNDFGSTTTTTTTTATTTTGTTTEVDETGTVTTNIPWGNYTPPAASTDNSTTATTITSTSMLTNSNDVAPSSLSSSSLSTTSPPSQSTTTSNNNIVSSTTSEKNAKTVSLDTILYQGQASASPTTSSSSSSLDSLSSLSCIYQYVPAIIIPTIIILVGIL